MGGFLEVADLSLSFGGIKALAGVGVQIAEGETLAVIGPNGSGKTSLFNCITGIYRPAAGAITFKGESLLGLSTDAVTRRGVARTFQNLRLFLNMSVLDNLMVGRHLHFKKNLLHAVLRLRGEELRHRRRCEEIIEFLNLELYRKSRVADCPFGICVDGMCRGLRTAAVDPSVLPGRTEDYPFGGIGGGIIFGERI